MTHSNQMQLTVKRHEPVVWISRVVLFKSTKPDETIREIKLHRGMNIIWGVDEDEDGGDEVVVAGHGVGKTSFCRLLRYCLGEATFGTKTARERIRAEFPQGYVAAEIHVEGAIWAVARSIGKSGRSHAREAATIEELLADRSASDSYDDFRRTIEDAVLQNLVAGMTTHTKEAIKWDHLLAWCARDQEARYQALWYWRSPRSESESPAFSKPKVDGLFLIRAVLGLLTGDEVELDERLAELEEEAEHVDKEIAEARREPEYWCRHLGERLIALVGVDDADAELANDDSLFGIRQREGAHRARLERQVGEIDEKLTVLDEQIADMSATLKDRAQEVRFLEAAVNTSLRAAGELVDGVAERREERDTLAKTGSQMCMYGRVTINECTHVQHRLKTLSFTEAADDEHAKSLAVQREAAVKEAQQDLAELRASSEESEQQRRHLIDQRRTLHDERDAAAEEISELSSVATSLERWTAVREGKQPNTRLAELRTQASANKDEQQAVRAKLVGMLSKHEAHLKELQTIYDHAVKSVLSQPYSGVVSLGQAEVEFQIRHGTTMAGEAIVTLAVLLADVCAMLLGATGRGCHPSMVIHDSPREADLGPRIYRSYLRFVAGLHDQLGGPANASFQYIVTTTTAPPPELRNDEYLRLRLFGGDSSEGLLFRTDLGSSADDEPGDGQMLLRDAGEDER